MRAIAKESFNLRSIANALFIICVAAIATLPSGALAGVPIKYFLLLVVLCYFSLSGMYYSRAFVTNFVGVAAFFIIYAAYGFAGFGRNAISELVLALGGILLGMLVAHVMERRGLGATGLLSAYKLSILIFGLLKGFILVAYFLSPSFTAFIQGFVASYQEVTGSKFVSMELPFGLVRVYMQYDLVAALFPLALSILRLQHRVTFGDRCFVFLCLVVVLLSFSRFNIACYGVSLLAFLWVDKRGWCFKLALSIMAGLVFVMFFKEIVAFIEVRFFSHQNQISDEVRFNQAAVLLDFYKTAPILGHGLGAYTENLIRSPSVPFSYEQQILSLLPKLGLIGASVAFCYVSYLFWRLLYIRQFYTFVFLALFLVASLFNPYLFSSNMIVVYALVFYVYFYSSPQRQWVLAHKSCE